MGSNSFPWPISFLFSARSTSSFLFHYYFPLFLWPGPQLLFSCASSQPSRAHQPKSTSSFASPPAIFAGGTVLLEHVCFFSKPNQTQESSSFTHYVAGFKSISPIPAVYKEYPYIKIIASSPSPETLNSWHRCCLRCTEFCPRSSHR